MPEGRYDLILLGWTAFVGFNLVSDFLWSTAGASGRTAPAGDAVGGAGSAGIGSAGLGSSSTVELYRGDYRISVNGSSAEEGELRMMLASQQTAVMSARISSMSIAFFEVGRQSRWRRSSFASFQADLLFSGMELGDLGKVTATGYSNPNHFVRFGTSPCQLDAVVRIGKTATHEQGSDAAKSSGAGGSEQPSTLVGEVTAAECGFTVVFAAEAVDVLYLTQKVVHYSIWVNVLTILQIRCFLMQMRHTDEGPSAAKVSIVCIAMQALMDAYDSFLHLCLGLSSQYMFNTIAVVAIFKFILFSLLEARYLLTIWRSRNSEAFNQGWESVRRELYKLYSRFYGALICGLVIIYNNLDHLDKIVLAFQAYWVPQILYDAWQGSRSAVRPAFSVLIAITRTLLVLYLWGCPSGIFSGDLFPRLPGSPSQSLCAAVLALQGFQLTVMMLQQRLGPRWFVPWVCRPWAYNYHRTARVEPGTDCVICMSELDPEDSRKVVTPCNHKFHQACLEQWMDVKMECPTCRNSLPPIS